MYLESEEYIIIFDEVKESSYEVRVAFNNLLEALGI